MVIADCLTFNSILVQKKVTILGGGESGAGAAILAKSKGFEVFLSDKGQLHQKYADILTSENIPFEQGQHSEARILESDLVAPVVRQRNVVVAQHRYRVADLTGRFLQYLALVPGRLGLGARSRFGSLLELVSQRELIEDD